MPLSSGTRPGHYDDSALLGEGGMGKVWQATDKVLGCEVALRILPEAFTSDSDPRVRSVDPLHTSADGGLGCFLSSQVRGCR